MIHALPAEARTDARTDAAVTLARAKDLLHILSTKLPDECGALPNFTHALPASHCSDANTAIGFTLARAKHLPKALDDVHSCHCHWHTHWRTTRALSACVC